MAVSVSAWLLLALAAAVVDMSQRASPIAAPTPLEWTRSVAEPPAAKGRTR